MYVSFIYFLETELIIMTVVVARRTELKTPAMKAMRYACNREIGGL
jgi:hypothetical protein